MRSRHARGFTLIEALVAMTIISVALIACLKAAGNLNLQQDEMLKRQYALWSAESMAKTLRHASVFPDAQTLSTPCNQGNFQLLCQTEITNTPNPNFRRVEILVLNAASPERSNQLARLVIFLSSAP
mgnify:CR=1 FL=1